MNMNPLNNARAALSDAEVAQSLRVTPHPTRLMRAIRGLIAEHERVIVDRDYMVTNAEGLHRSGQRLAAEVERLTAPPTDDEREALGLLLAKLREARYPEGLDAWSSDDIAHAVLAAGFRRPTPITDAEVERAAAGICFTTDHPGQGHVDWPDQLDAVEIARAALEAAREVQP